MKRYWQCEACGSTTLVILGATNPRAWALRCENDHVVVPHDGFKLELKLEVEHAPGIVIPQPKTVRGLLRQAIAMDRRS